MIRGGMTLFNVFPKVKLEDKRQRWLKNWQREFKTGRVKGVKKYYLYEVGDWVVLSDGDPISPEMESLFPAELKFIEVLIFQKLCVVGE